MSDHPPLFGSFGSRTAPNGQTSEGVSSRVWSRPTFGIRNNPPYRRISLQRERLAHLREELCAVFSDDDTDPAKPSFVLLGYDRPQLLVQDTAIVSIDEETGLLVFTEKETHSGVVVVTASAERLIDHIIRHLANSTGASGEEAYNQAANMLVGQTLAQVERRVILQTLRACYGNRTRAATMLGISLRAVRNKLRSYWRAPNVGGDAK